MFSPPFLMSSTKHTENSQYPAISFVGGPYNGTVRDLDYMAFEHICRSNYAPFVYAGRLYAPIGYVTGTSRLVAIYIGNEE